MATPRPRTFGRKRRASQADILVALAQNDVSPDAHDFWDELWKLDTTAEDVFELISADDVRHLRRERPENVVTLFTQAVAQLCQIVHTPVPMYFGQALNCLRVLTRLLPFLLEDAGSEFCEQLCWGVDAPSPEQEGDDAADAEAAEPLARLVVHATMHLLFLPGFTVDAAAFEDEPEDALVPERALWAPGLGGLDARPAASLALDRNRAEVLRLLLACSCEPLYARAEGFDPWASRWLNAATARDGAAVQLDGLDGGTVCLTLRRTACGGEGVSFNFGELSGCAAARPATLRRHERGSLLATFSAPSCRRGRLLNK